MGTFGKEVIVDDVHSVCDHEFEALDEIAHECQAAVHDALWDKRSMAAYEQYVVLVVLISRLRDFTEKLAGSLANAELEPLFHDNAA